MSDSGLPQPIYPTGDAAGAPPPPGPPPSGGGVDPKVWIAVGVVVAIVVVGLVVFLATRSGGGSSDRAVEPTPDRDEPVTPEGPDEPAVPVEPAGDDLRGRAEAVAFEVFDNATAGTAACMADELEGQPDFVDEMETVLQMGGFSDPGSAYQLADIVLACANTQELIDEYEGVFIAFGYEEPVLSCMVENMNLFDHADWRDFIAMFTQPAEAVNLEQIISAMTFCPSGW